MLASYIRMTSSLGRFGTAVVSYFVFLKYLFLMNLLMFLIWTCFVSVPHFIWRGSPSGVTAYENSTTSQLTCLLGLDQLPGNTSCTSYCGGIHVVSDCPQNTSTFPSSDCSVVDGAVFWTSGTAKSVQVESVTCLNSTEYCLCRSVPVAATEWYQHIIDFITGQGLFNTTVLFIGQYHNGRINEVYDMPVAYLLTAGWLYVLSITIIVWRYCNLGDCVCGVVFQFPIYIFRMGVAFGDSYTRLVYGSKIDYCNKVFTAWDFNVTDRKASRLKREAIKTELQVRQPLTHMAHLQLLRSHSKGNFDRPTKERRKKVLQRSGDCHPDKDIQQYICSGYTGRRRSCHLLCSAVQHRTAV